MTPRLSIVPDKPGTSVTDLGAQYREASFVVLDEVIADMDRLQDSINRACPHEPIPLGIRQELARFQKVLIGTSNNIVSLAERAR